MKEIGFWIIISASLVILFFVMLFIAIIKRNKRLAVWSIVPIIISIMTGGIASFKIFNKGYTQLKHVKLENPFKARTGEDIYTALFGKSTYNCTIVQNKKDQYIPGLDCCIWLEFSTCPNELKRILVQQNYTLETQSSTTVNISGDNEKPDWWKPEQLGDSILFFKYDLEGKRLQQLISSTDSTKVYYCDMLY